MFRKSLDDVRSLIRVGKGEKAPTLVISDCTVLDAFSGRLFPGSLWVDGRWIAYVLLSDLAAATPHTVVEGGQIRLDGSKVLCTGREKKTWGKGFVKGLGFTIGAVASSVGHDSHGLLPVGFDDRDMVVAGKRPLF